MKWYQFNQNNSGGYTIVNYDVGEDVFIQAENEHEAVAKFSVITEDYLDYCECCGERWVASPDSEADVPSVYGKPISEKYSPYGGGHAVLYYADGEKEIFNQH